MHDSEQIIEEVQQLVWALVDEVATDEQMQRLEALVVEHAEARKAYVDCMSLHAELHCMFAPPQPIKPLTLGKTPTPIAPTVTLDPPIGGNHQTV